MRRWLAWLAALALGGCAPAGEPAVRPALWRAVHGGSTIWLFGTIHLLPADVKWNIGKVAQAVAQADTLITEIPEGDAQAQAAAFLKVARAEGLPPIAERVAPGERAALTAAIDVAGLPTSALDRMTTWGAALAIGAGAARGAGATVQAAPEAVLARAFAGRRREALESFAGQLGIFAELAEADQRLLLSRTLTEARDARASYARMLAAWSRGDAAAMQATFNRAFAGAPELAAALITRRNRAWADRLAARGNGTALVAVGAGHMIGSAGLPALLSARGYRVARVQ
ncbi:MAG: TraB/GumN family protein [Pseudomonadota bacterium]